MKFNKYCQQKSFMQTEKFVVLDIECHWKTVLLSSYWEVQYVFATFWN